MHVNALPIGVNPFSNIVIDICVDGSFGNWEAARLALDWSSLGFASADWWISILFALDCLCLIDWHV